MAKTANPPAMAAKNRLSVGSYGFSVAQITTMCPQ